MKEDHSISLIQAAVSKDMAAIEAQKLNKESKVGQKLGDLTTKKMILIILAMLFSVPLFDVTSYINPPTSYQIGLAMLAAFPEGSPGFDIVMQSMIQEELQSITPVLSVAALNVSWQTAKVNVRIDSLYNYIMESRLRI